MVEQAETYNFLFSIIYFYKFKKKKYYHNFMT